MFLLTLDCADNVLPSAMRALWPENGPQSAGAEEESR